MTQIFVKYILHLCNFRHLKLEIALAIPASNDEKYNSYTSISGSWHAPRPGSQRVNPLDPSLLGITASPTEPLGAVDPTGDIIISHI